MNPNYFRFAPVYRDRVWGGRKFASHLGRTDMPAGVIGESWELVDRDDAQSVVVGGPRAGATLRELLEADPEGIMGPGWSRERRFPLLVKWLDCSQRLSLQVHPDEQDARRHGGEPKTEFWYVGHAEPGAELFAGLKPGVNRAGLAAAIRENRLEHEVNRYETHADDCLYIPAGTLHAIGAGNLILEIQQNSDTTYRVYDWGRPRELHVEQALRCLRTGKGYDDIGAFHAGQAVLVDGDFFRIRHREVPAGGLVHLRRAESSILNLAAGSAMTDDGVLLAHGETLLIPAGKYLGLRCESACKFLITDRFAASARRGLLHAA